MRRGTTIIASLLALSQLLVLATLPAPVAAEDNVVSGTHVVSLEETWGNITIAGTGRLVVPAGTVLNAMTIEGEPGSILEVTGGRIFMNNPEAGGDVGIHGSFRFFNVTDGSSLQLNGSDAAPDVSGPGPFDVEIPASQGGTAMLDVTASGGIDLDNCTITLRGGKGFDLPPSNATCTSAWTTGDLVNSCAAGGDASLALRTTATGKVRIADLTVVLVGGDGGRASDGGDCNSDAGAFGGGYSDGGNVTGNVGMGGKARFSIGSPTVSIDTADIECVGGDGGAAGHGGSTWSASNGGAGGGGYSGGDGGDLGRQGSDGGDVSGRVGSGGDAIASIQGDSVAAMGLVLQCSGGSGGRAGDGGTSHFTGDGAGGGGYGGGGGGGYRASGGLGSAMGRAGAGGGASIDVTGLSLELWLCELWSVGGAGGRAGNGGVSSYGGGGGGGYGGGGGGGAYGGNGGAGEARNSVGSGGPAAVAIDGLRVNVTGGRMVGYGGHGGNAGNGGDAGPAVAGNAGGGGGAGYAGGGGAGSNSQSGYQGRKGGDGVVDGPIGSGGDASVSLGGMRFVMRGASLYLTGGDGGDAGEGGAGVTGSPGGGGGGGGYGGAGGASNTRDNIGGHCTVRGDPGLGGNATMSWEAQKPSVSRACAFTPAAGEAGDGTASHGGGGVSGGEGAGATTSGGILDAPVPMSVALPMAPETNSFVRLGEKLPRFEWLDLHSSTTNGDVVNYVLDLDDDPDFLSPLTSQTTTSTNFAYSPQLPIGKYYWRVMARYSAPPDASAGWSETWIVSVNEDIKPTSRVDALPAYTTTKVLTVRGSAEDLESGILSVELWYSIDGDPWTLYGTDSGPLISWDFDTSMTGEDGSYEFYSRAWDIAHNHEDGPSESDTCTIVDTIAPVSSLDPLPPFSTSAALILSANASDLNGVTGVEVWYRRDGGPWLLYGEATTTPYRLTFDTALTEGDGTYEFCSRARDVAGNVEGLPPTNGTWTVVDTTAPTSRVDALPAYVTDAALIVTANTSDRSGITRVELWYSRDSGIWTMLPEAGTSQPRWAIDLEGLGGDGMYQFYTRAWDVAGNYEDAPLDNDTWTTLDTAPPTSRVDALPAYSTSVNVDITASAYDVGGLASVELWYKRDDGSWTMYDVTTSTPVQWAFDTAAAGGDGRFQFHSRAWDAAGHYEDGPVGNDTWMLVDTVAPVSVVDRLPDHVTYAPFEVRAGASDANGVAKVELWYQREGGAWAIYGVARSIPAVWSFDTSRTGGDGRYAFYSRAWDAAENREDASSSNDTWTVVDTVGPRITVLNPANGSTIRSSRITLSFTAADASGLAHVEARLDDDNFVLLDDSGSYVFEHVKDGRHTLSVRAVDRYDNVNETSLEVRVITEASGSGTAVYVAFATVLVAVMAITALLVARRRRASR